MKLIIGVGFFFTSLILAFIILSSKRNRPRERSLISRFKSRFKNKDRRRERITEEFSYSLMTDPEINITIGTWYNEDELREKADIHRARLSKHGRSKINGEMLYLGPKGGVYKLTPEGKKKYL